MLSGRPALPHQTEIGAGFAPAAGIELAQRDTNAADCRPLPAKPAWHAPNQTNCEPPWSHDTVVTTGKPNVVAAIIIVAAGLAAYSGSFFGPFVFDDPSSITANPTIRQLWPPWDILATPRANVTVQGRPILNLSFALNYAISESKVWSYHGLNLVIHLLAGLTLFGLVRRTLLLDVAAQETDSGRRTGPCPSHPETDFTTSRDITATLLGFSVALLWTVHPLQTESVTYVVQRAESLMGLFYLLTMYGFARSAATGGAGRRWQWATLSVLACALGMATKEVMVSAPVIVLLYDRTFVVGSFRAAWEKRRGYYGWLAAGWLVLGLCLLRGGGNRGGSIGFGVGVPWWTYGLTQFEAIGRYLLLSLWPHPLVFEYGAFRVQRAGEVLPWAVILVPLVVGTLWALWRRPVIGFLGAFFFSILAPTSLVPGTSQMIVEHRMYLSLAVVLVLILHAGHTAISRASFTTLVLLVATGFGWLTLERNTVYRSELSLWTDTVQKRPANQVAHAMLAEAHFESGRLDPAQFHYETAVKIDPTFFVAHERLAELLLRRGRQADAAGHFDQALRLRPDFADAHNNYGILLAQVGKTSEAMVHIERALALKPDYVEAHFALANTLAEQGRNREAIVHYEAVIRLKPDLPGAEFNLANTLAAMERREEATVHYRAALRLRPNHPAAEFNLANTLALLHRSDEAVTHYREALRLKPDFAEAEMNLGSALFELGRPAEAEAHYLAALRLDPRMEDARASLARVRAAVRR